MTPSTAAGIIECLPKERTLFHYYRDRYATYLLERAFPEGAAIAAVKASPFAKLLQRPALKAIAAGKGDGLITPADLAQLWAGETETYRLTLTTWGRLGEDAAWNQSARNGVTLVLQLNFSKRHNAAYRALVDPQGAARPFEVRHHPVAHRGLHTLSWARMDVELDEGEALIEEIQCDWVRIAALGKRVAQTLASDPEIHRAMHFAFRGADIEPEAMLRYFEVVLSTHLRLWEEATLTAALWFVREELGLKRVYYHDYECGSALKAAGEPPRSLYTQLPARFCFQRTPEPPRMLSAAPSVAYRRLEKAGELSFWRMAL